jgi:Tol biopolymer transport system component
MRMPFVLAIAAAAAFAATPTASASFPGANGKIVFGTLHAGEDEIWTMNPDGSDRRNLTRHDGRKIGDIDPRWSPDARQIAFVRDDTNTGGDMQIWVMDADGSNQHAVTNLGGGNRLPSWTADAKQIIFQHSESGNSEIYRVNVDGTGVTNLTNDAAIDWAPATSPTGKKIVFTSEREGNGHLYVLTPDGQPQRVTTGPDYDYLR